MEERIYFKNDVTRKRLGKKGYTLIEKEDSISICKNAQTVVELILKYDRIAVLTRKKLEGYTDQVGIDLIGEQKDCLALDLGSGMKKRRICPE